MKNSDFERVTSTQNKLVIRLPEYNKSRFNEQIESYPMLKVELNLWQFEYAYTNPNLDQCAQDEIFAEGCKALSLFYEAELKTTG